MGAKRIRGLGLLASLRLCAGLVLSILGMAAGAEDFSTWTHTARIRINTTAAGANVAKDIVKFPLLIRLPKADPAKPNIMSQSLAEGADIRFVDPDGTPLDFQMERWDPESGAEFWVLVPQVDGNSDKDYIDILWGKSGAPWLSDGAKVFLRTMGFEGVWHLGEPTTQTRGNSVGAFNHAVPKNYKGIERVKGVIGMADSLIGVANQGGKLWGGATLWSGLQSPASGSYLDVGSGFANMSRGMTFTIWAKTANNGNYARFMDFGNGPSADNVIFGRRDTSNVLNYQVYNATTASGRMTVDKGFDENAWTMVGVTQEADNVSLYKNGVLLQTFKSSTIPRDVIRTQNFLGRSHWSNDGDYTGILDEPEFSFAVRSADFMKLNYESQRPDGKLLTWEAGNQVKLTIVIQPVSKGAVEGATVSLKTDATSSADQPIAYQWYKDGTALDGAGARNKEISFAAIRLDDAGKYHCRVTDGRDTLITNTATISVPEILATWEHSQKIVFTTAAAGVAAEVDDFPLLVRLNDGRLDFSQTGAGGKDLRFADADGTALPLFIERWDEQARTADVWVRVPRIDGNSDRDFITLYWGKPTARAVSNAAAVFSPSNDFTSVYPLNENADVVPDLVETSANGKRNGAAGGVPGHIGSAYRFSGGASSIELPKGILSGVQEFSVFFWAKGAQLSQQAGAVPSTLFGMTTAGTASGDFGITSTNGKLGYWGGFLSGVDNGSGTTLSIDDGQWHLIGVTYDGNSFDLYEGGLRVLSQSASGIAVGDYSFAIGASHTETGAFSYGFIGDIDAVQVSAKARSAHWIKLAYETQRVDSKALQFGAPSNPPPPSPIADPPAGAYDGFLSVRLTCAADNASIFYTLDGTEPDTVARGSTAQAVAPIPILQSAVLKAKAYRAGIAGSVLTAGYILRVASDGLGDTLSPGNSVKLDPTHSLVYPVQAARVPVRVSIGSAWDPAPPGFDHLGPLITLTATDTLAAFPGLEVAGENVAGVQLYRRVAESNRWQPANEGALWIPSAGAYFWGRDTLPPRIRYAGTDTHGADSLLAFFVLEDNVANLRCRLRVRNGAEDDLGWRSADQGEMLRFPIRLPASPLIPLELNLTATDERSTSVFPSRADGNYTVPLRLASVSASLELASGNTWKLTGLPFEPESPLTLPELASVSGSGKLAGAYWKTSAGAEGEYIPFASDDALPAGKGFWIAASEATRKLVFPASRTLASDTDGLFAIPLRNGWNLVTCPSFRPVSWPVSAKDGEAYLRSSLKGLRGYDGSGYTHPDSLRPFEGYYVWYGGGDTVVHVGAGLRRVTDPAAFTGAKSAGAKTGAKTGAARAGHASGGFTAAGIRLAFRGRDGAANLEIGAIGFARSGLGNEDELQPPAPEASATGQAWISRAGRALSMDYVPWEPDRAMAWTLIVHSAKNAYSAPSEHSAPNAPSAPGKPPGYLFDLESASLPEGYQAWAVSPTRRVKYRLQPGGTLPVTGADTLSVYAGTPEALAKVADLIRGREVPTLGGFAFSLRNLPGGLELALDLPSAATVDVRLWTPAGSEAGGLRGLRLAPGRHVWPGSALSPSGFLSQGVYFLEIRAQGGDWSARRVRKFGSLR